jgi:hypothetical protein
VDMASSRRDPCCRALKLQTMPSVSMHRKHQVVRRRDDGVLDMMMAHLQARKWWWTGRSSGRSRSHEIAIR